MTIDPLLRFAVSTIEQPPDDELDGALGGEARPLMPGSIGELTQRAQRAGFPTLAAYIDHLEGIEALYAERRDWP